MFAKVSYGGLPSPLQNQQSYVRIYLIFVHRGGQEQILPSKQLFIFLCYMANKETLREIAHYFGVAKYTVFVTLCRVSEAFLRRLLKVNCFRIKECKRSTFIFMHDHVQCILDLQMVKICYNILAFILWQKYFICLFYQVIKWPSFAEQNEIARENQLNHGLPDIMGYLDGTHIPLAGCPKSDKDYVNRKGFPSMQLQVILKFDLIAKLCCFQLFDTDKRFTST